MDIYVNGDKVGSYNELTFNATFSKLNGYSYSWIGIGDMPTEYIAQPLTVEFVRSQELAKLHDEFLYEEKVDGRSFSALIHKVSMEPVHNLKYTLVGSIASYDPKDKVYICKCDRFCWQPL